MLRSKDRVMTLADEKKISHLKIKSSNDDARKWTWKIKHDLKFFYGQCDLFIRKIKTYKKNIPEGYYPSNADKSPVERLSLNRSQCGGYSTKYNTLTET